MAPGKRDFSKDTLLIMGYTAVDDAWVARIEKKFPGLTVRWVHRAEPTLRSQLAAEVLAHEWKDVTIACCFLPAPAEVMSSVQLVQAMSAGADLWLDHPFYKDPNTVICTTNGIFAPPIAEWAITTWLMHQHHFLDSARNMETQTWGGPYEFDITDSPGKRMGILGYGAIGRQCARLAKALGMEVYAYTRREKATADSRRDDSFIVAGGTGDPEGLLPDRWCHGPVNDFLAQDLDVLVISVPLTASTAALIGAEQFDVLGRRKAFVINVARGGIVRTDALVDALRQGKIRGAALDVTDPEPLPADHPLWRAPNVFITPHTSWQVPDAMPRTLAVLETNLERLRDGERLVNVVDKEHHY